MGSSERGGDENPVEGGTGGVASARRSVPREILAAKTGWNWIGHSEQRIPGHRIQTNARHEKQQQQQEGVKIFLMHFNNSWSSVISIMAGDCKDGFQVIFIL